VTERVGREPEIKAAEAEMKPLYWGLKNAEELMVAAVTVW
jgi:hypothetical protein